MEVVYCISVLLLIFHSFQANANSVPREDLFPVSIIHINDFHARFEETDTAAVPCSPGKKCIGGYGRIVTMVKELLEMRKATNPIYLNAGDNFQGTLWYNIGRWNVTSHFLNLLPADAITLGNHEFDHGIEGVVPFLKALNAPMIDVNIDDSEEPSIQGLYKKSIIIERYARKIGVIGVILQTTDQIANTGKLKFLDESETVKAEAERLKREDDVDIIIVLSHCGLDVDRIIAKNGGPLIDVIVGGHSHTFLFTGEDLPGPEKPQDNYPVEIYQDNGHRVLIVQASCYAKYVGDITVYFNSNGDVEEYDGAPIYMNTDIIPDPFIMQELQPWKEIMDEKGNEEVGKSSVVLSKSSCNYDECNLGNFLNDAFVHAYAIRTEKNYPHWTSAAIALTNVGGIRTTLDKGVLTYAHLVTTMPFENSIDAFDLRGKYLLEALEYSVAQSYSEEEFSARNMLQVSGLKVTYNISKPIGNRVVDVLVRCQKCSIPKYEPIDPNEVYRIIAASFLAAGGDGFNMFKDYRENVEIGPIDIDVFSDYVKMQSPVMKENDERIIVLK